MLSTANKRDNTHTYTYTIAPSDTAHVKGTKGAYPEEKIKNRSTSPKYPPVKN
jgi:hypothetical protein